MEIKSTDAGLIKGVEVLGLRPDYKKKKWYPKIDSGSRELHTGYYYTTYNKPTAAAGWGGHFVYRTHVKVSGIGRGQSAFYMDLENVRSMLRYPGTLSLGATGILTFAKFAATNKLKVVDEQEGIVELDFIIEKTGSNVYVEPIDINNYEMIAI